MGEKMRALAIDGPAGAGKSTIARAVSRELGWIYVDTGAVFRALALFLLRGDIPAERESEVAEALEGAEVSLSFSGGEQRVFLNGEDISEKIREERVGELASAVSAYPAVRGKVLALERKIAAASPVVMDGRDIGTVVLPDADTKVYLTASPEIRAERRWRELCGRGEACSREDILRGIRERDERDSSRSAAPLRQADDAVRVDSSELSEEQVRELILRLVREKEL